MADNRCGGYPLGGPCVDQPCVGRKSQQIGRKKQARPVGPAA